MAEENLPLKHFLTCSVCTEILKDPVSLGCHHSFCSSCLQDFWAQAENKNCPVCKRKSSKDVVVNFSIKELADSYARRQRSAPSDEAQVVCTEPSQRSAPSDEAQVVCTEPSQRSAPSDKAQVVCTEHLKDIKWFCKEEQRAVCHVCEFPHHQGHTVVPLEEPVQELKQQLTHDLTALQARRRRHQELEETYEAMVPHLKGQRVKTERRIRAEFEQLHRFLREEEEARVKALREEEEQKRKRILLERKTLQEQIRSLSEGLSAVEADLQKDGLSFLSASTRSRTSARALLSGSDPQLLPGALLDEAKHLGNLAHRVWEEMGQRTTFSPVTLDPNTASHSLSLSDDLTSVRVSDVTQKVPNNPERFTRYPNVLGSEGFSSGEHCWEVEVGDHPIWIIGVAKESVDRKGVCTASPDNGIWCLVHRSGKYAPGTGQTLTLKRTPERIRVQLDYDGGEVSFYDPEDMTLIYTYQDTFTGNIFPWFALGPAGEAQTKAVRVCGVSSRTKPCK
ncbi:zinc-binding protein A33-like [Gadus chalcogrammus]|uniref:zinc-binding protein A33-like n=1 Tax=Gadus chalcogrammus TaxID=1042646 RepID=UPI0024C4E054|nr:zinc-binding protein A33-like [Gadus chalcogrammus]XP_056464678.1 zinc-binding protein A33-like [Gadus chalcogrammus]